MSRHLLSMIAAAIAFALTLTPLATSAQAAVTAPEELASALKHKRAKCLSAAIQAVGSTPNARKALDALDTLPTTPACEEVDIKPPEKVDQASLTFSKVVVVVDEEIENAWKDYQCANRAAVPECRALTAAMARQADLRLIKQGKASTLPAGRYNRTNNTLWSKDNKSFGTAAGVGISFMRLSLDGVGSDLAQRAYPDTMYETILDDLDEAQKKGRTDQDCTRSDCGLEVARVISLYPLFQAIDSSFMLVTYDGFDKTIELLDKRVARWNAYHFGGGQGRAQLPWELVANSLIYTHFGDRKPNAPISEKTPLDDIWLLPPKGALILLHPSPGLAMKDTKGDSLVVNAVELVGVSRWDYDDKTQSRTNEWGISALAAYRARDDAKNWGYGVLVRTPLELSSLPINIVWTRTKLNAGGHDDTVALSVDISRYVPKWKNAACLFKLPSCEKGS